MKKSMKRWYGICRDCQKKEINIENNDWFHASKPRCTSCGGFLERKRLKIYKKKKTSKKKPVNS